jgi:hypothetical protein
MGEMGDCNVCLYSDDSDGYFEFLEQDVRKSRKERTCEECQRVIAVGERYEASRGKWEGEFWTWTCCLLCAEIAETFYCDGRMYGRLWEDMQEAAFPELTTGCLDRLKTAAAKEYLLSRWNAWKFRNVA